MEAHRLALLLVLISALRLKPVQSHCLNLKEETPKKYITPYENPIPLTLGVTERLTHQLTTHVYKIFLEEILNYSKVEIVPVTQESVDGIFPDGSDRRPVDEPIPLYMVDLEVWLPLEQDTIVWEDVRDMGNIGLPGRYGWYIPSRSKKEHPIRWTDLQIKSYAKTFSLTDKEIHQLLRYSKNSSGAYYCTSDLCQNGVYTPDRCKKESCATLIASHSRSTEFVISDIERLQLFVQVFWVGPNLPKLVKSLSQSRRNEPIPFLFLAGTPDLLAIKESFEPVEFPYCDLYLNQTVCNYSNKRLIKVAWRVLQQKARPVWESLLNLKFSIDDYRELVDSYIGGNWSFHDVACQWMNNHALPSHNRTSWLSWKTTLDNHLYLLGIFPLSSQFLQGRGTFFSADMAVSDVNNNPSVLKNHQLRILLDNAECQADLVVRSFIENVQVHNYLKTAGILGPACSDTVEPVAGISKYFNMIVISYSAEGSSFSDRVKYPYFFRTIGENKQYKYVYLDLFKRLGWRRVASLTEDGTKYTEYISLTQDLLQKNGISFVINRKFPQEWITETYTMHEYLDEFKAKNARIIIADVNNDAAKAMMCEAYHLKMTAKQGYVWFLPLWLTPFWEHKANYNVTISGRTLACSHENMQEAINGHLSLSHAFYAPDNWTIHTGQTVKQWRDRYKQDMAMQNLSESDYAGYAYDAVWTYAFAMDALFKENASYVSSLHSESTTKRFVQLIQNTSFAGVSGQIHFKAGPSRNTTINIVQWVNMTRRVVGSYDPNAPLGQDKFVLNYPNKIVWFPDGKVPLDGTSKDALCVIESFAKLLNADCQVAIIVANIIGFGFFILVLFIGFLVIKHRYDKKVRITKKYMKSLGIDLLSVSTMGNLGLDKWEIPKDRVVINRKLGEGAFGYVYGGEAFFNEKGWMAVAVKTLKVGSTTEEKLDFLSEAEVMKRFEHINIVQLLGVCTKNEPVYTIMEFMLYGDLKTFLLARRHLVNERLSDDADEISNKKLTNMALDVARALSYLAELKYVHRDIASRNCLVNASRVVKLGDFGMTRPMFENDYYKFNRKGMLPVRWMAPESLVLGIFTPGSDVWSYGVLLYEIVTFGSFPFQGMTNNQVLEHVKAGNTLTIPTNIKPQLTDLIKSCWDKDPKKRPRAAEIVETLAASPRLISPCLDVPLSAVQMEDAGTMDMSLATGTSSDPKARKFSMTLRQRTPPSPLHDVRRWNEAADPLLPSPTKYRPVLNHSSISEEPLSNHIDSLL